MKPQRILVVDDDPGILKFVRANLKVEGYETLAALDGAEALKIAEKELPDLVILDIMMPEPDGFEVCRRLRGWSPVPIIMLSVRDDSDDKVKCLNLGADDYLTKPFAMDELIARVKTVLRRAEGACGQPEPEAYCGGELEIDFLRRQVTRAGKEVKLTPTEFCLLHELVQHKGKVLTHLQLLQKVWGPEYARESEYLHVYAGRLRAKLEADPANPRHIITVTGVGYEFRE